MISQQQDRLDLIADAAQCELARRHLLDFCRRLHPKFKAPPHIEQIAKLLEQVEAGRLRKLIINVPPRHGKSLILQLFCSWFLGRNPSRNIITASHSAELAERNSRYTRGHVESDAWPFASRLSEESSAVHRWNLAREDGGVYAVGAGGSITGRGANLLVLDDIEHDAGTPAERESTWRWYSEIAVPRLEPGAAEVVIATRWAIDDLVGRQLDLSTANNWHLLSLPAIAEEDDPLDRSPGEPLWPERFSLDELLERKIAMGGRAFSAQFQQDPVPATGTIFRAEWLNCRFTRLGASRISSVIAVDAGWKTGIQNDYSAAIYAVTDGRDFFVIDAMRGKWEYPDLRRHLVDFFTKHRPHVVVVEDTAAGTTLVQELKDNTLLPIVPVQARGSKESRAESVAPLFEANKVTFMDSAPWLEDLTTELLRFPGGAHDDYVDALVYALLRLREASNSRPAMAWSGPGGPIVRYTGANNIFR